MYIVNETLVSDELKNVYFSCDLSQCHGNCCVEGDAGAPLEEEEISVLEDIIDEIKPYMSEQGVKVIEKTGIFDYDADGTYVTPLINDRECAFAVFENGIAFCAIEKAWKEKKISFQKPISCHLYPVRLAQVGQYIAVNYDRWDICQAALLKGKREKVPLYEYLKTPLIRRFGNAWYNQLKKEMEEREENRNFLEHPH